MADLGVMFTDEVIKIISHRLKKIYAEAEKDLSGKLADFVDKHKARDKKYRALVEAGKMDQDDYEAWLRGQVFQQKQWENKVKQIAGEMLKVDQTAQKIVDGEKQNIFTMNANYVGYDLENGLRANVSFTIFDSSTVARLIKDQPDLLKALSKKKILAGQEIPYYQKIVTNAITQGIIQGESIPQIAKRITTTCAQRGENAALRDARTAYTGAQNAGRVAGMRQSQSLGINVKKRWLATLDFVTRDAHRDLDGQTVDVDEDFHVNGERIAYPGDPTAEPALVYNCRCSLEWYYPDYSSSRERYDNETGEIVGDMTYKEWYKMKTAKRD